MPQRLGLWLIGARGGVATVAATGLAALRRQLIDQRGLVTALPLFSGVQLVAWDDIVLGGHEIRQGNLVQQALEFQQTSRAFPLGLVEQIEEELAAIDQRFRQGVLHRSGRAIEALADAKVLADDRSVAAKTAQIEQDLQEFRQQNDLSQIVVVNVSSTEPPVDTAGLPATWDAMAEHVPDLPVSSLYAIAAMKTGCGYVNFTPSLGSNLPALDELARQSAVAHAGRDGKTGETLIKSILAPAFAMRNLGVLSWVGHNIFGNMDGLVLDDPRNKETKVQSKDQLLAEILGYQPQTHISIEYIKSLGDWKTAWDHIHFEGFMGTPMVMQFTWQGCDSILAAPLILDLARLTERAMRAGQCGNLHWLACFFKSPMGIAENNLVHQFGMLQDWVGRLAGPDPD